MNKIEQDEKQCVRCRQAWTDGESLGPWLCLVCKLHVRPTLSCAKCKNEIPGTEKMLGPTLCYPCFAFINVMEIGKNGSD